MTSEIGPQAAQYCCRRNRRQPCFTQWVIARRSMRYRRYAIAPSVAGRWSDGRPARWRVVSFQRHADHRPRFRGIQRARGRHRLFSATDRQWADKRSSVAGNGAGLRRDPWPWPGVVLETIAELGFCVWRSLREVEVPPGRRGSCQWRGWRGQIIGALCGRQLSCIQQPCAEYDRWCRRRSDTGPGGRERYRDW